MNDYLNVIRNHYADFTGRARRREFWMFSLITAVITLILELPLLASIPAMAAAQQGDPNAIPALPPLALISVALVGIYGLATFVPGLAVSVRRLHDTGKSGWWYLLSLVPGGSIVLLVFFVLDSEPGSNKWGPNPKGLGASTVPASTNANW